MLLAQGRTANIHNEFSGKVESPILDDCYLALGQRTWLHTGKNVIILWDRFCI
jgi:hypothetical protein